MRELYRDVAMHCDDLEDYFYCKLMEHAPEGVMFSKPEKYEEYGFRRLYWTGNMVIGNMSIQGVIKR